MPQVSDGYPKLIIQQLQGLNERKQFSNDAATEFDILRNCIPANTNSLTKMLGSKKFATFAPSSASPVLAICQTFDSKRNIIVQCRDAVFIISENDLFGVTSSPSDLVPIPPIPPGPPPPTPADDEGYAQAVIVGIVKAWSGAGVVSQLDSILYQRNADGTVASFVTLSANQFTLQPGKYRIKFVNKATSTTTADTITTDINDVSFGVNVGFGGPYNSRGTTGMNKVAIANELLTMTGTAYIDISSPNIFCILNNDKLNHGALTTTLTLPAFYTIVTITKSV